MKPNNQAANYSTSNDFKSFNTDMQYVSKAQDCFLTKLFGFVPDNPSDYSVTRRAYIKAMKEVQKEFQLEQGDPRLVLFVLEQLSRSPRIIVSSRSSKKTKYK